MAERDRRDEQTVGEAASEPPGRRRPQQEEPGEPQGRHGDEELYEDVPGQSGEPAGDGP